MAKAVPDEELTDEDAEKELHQMRIYPILYAYSLRCFYWELFEVTPGN
jgi:hypothetical protein